MQRSEQADEQRGPRPMPDRAPVLAGRERPQGCAGREAGEDRGAR